MLVSAQELRIWMWSFAQHLLLYNDLPSVLLLPGPLDRSVLPCLPPASTLQIDVNGDAEWPARRSCVQEHACSFLTHPPSPEAVSPPNEHLSVWESNVLRSANCWSGSSAAGRLTGWTRLQLIHRGTPCVVCQGSKVSAWTPSSLMCVSIETATGKAGRMLISSQWACEAQLQAAVCHGEAEWVPS